MQCHSRVQSIFYLCSNSTCRTTTMQSLLRWTHAALWRSLYLVWIKTTYWKRIGFSSLEGFQIDGKFGENPTSYWGLDRNTTQANNFNYFFKKEKLVWSTYISPLARWIAYKHAKLMTFKNFSYFSKRAKKDSGFRKQSKHLCLSRRKTLTTDTVFCDFLICLKRLQSIQDNARLPSTIFRWERTKTFAIKIRLWNLKKTN